MFRLFCVRNEFMLCTNSLHSLQNFVQRAAVQNSALTIVQLALELLDQLEAEQSSAAGKIRASRTSLFTKHLTRTYFVRAQPPLFGNEILSRKCFRVLSSRTTIDPQTIFVNLIIANSLATYLIF